MINQIKGFLIVGFACYGVYTFLIPVRKGGKKYVR
jgi:hypothetical protein